jgi:hypothetical protein
MPGMALRGSTQVPVGPSDCDQAENLEFLAAQAHGGVCPWQPGTGTPLV